MKFVIDDDVIKRHGFTTQELFTCLALAESDSMSIYQMIDQLVGSGYAFATDDGDIKLYRNIRDKISKILLESEENIPHIKVLKDIATRMRPIFPTGLKEGTNCQWRNSIMGVALRLQLWWKIYNEDNTYSADDIIEATDQYVASFNGNYRFMRTIDNFVFKQINGEPTSDLATTLDNLGAVNTYMFDNAEFA